MKRLRKILREHWHFVLVATALTLVMTFPTILYVFRTDVFWLPTGSSTDVYIKLWDNWYGGLMLTGQADRFYTDLMFYPQGVSLTYHPLLIPQIIVVNALRLFLPLSNAFSLSFLLILFSTALSAYVYILYLFKDKWLALLGAVLFGFSPHVLGHPNHPDTAFIATVPLALYFFHRGVDENRMSHMLIAGVVTGLTTAVILYTFICLLIALAFYICAFAVSRWRRQDFWKLVILLMLAIALSSAWRLLPMVLDGKAVSSAVDWHGHHEVRTDLISSFVHHKHPIIGPFFEELLKTPEHARTSGASYLGYVPLLLIGLGLFHRASRRKMLPWLAMVAVFFILRLGPVLHVNGVTYADIRLPKHYLAQALPFVFKPFSENDNFHIGAILPLAVLTCYGAAAVCKARRTPIRPWIALLLIAGVAAEYYMPIRENVITREQTAFLDWLADEERDAIAVINLPMGRDGSKWYNLYQALSGYPQVEGAISRTPDEAFNYIRDSYLLGHWHAMQPVVCGWHNETKFIDALSQLEADGFTHVVVHQLLEEVELVADSFLGAAPSYRDSHVTIYRLNDLRDSCPSYAGPAHSFSSPIADILLAPSILHERPGLVIAFQQSRPEDPEFLQFYGLLASGRETLVYISDNETGGIHFQSSNPDYADLQTIVGDYNVAWVVHDPPLTNLTEAPAYHDWLINHFRGCRRFLDSADSAIDLYVNRELPCEAVGEDSDLGVLYENGDRLHQLHLERGAKSIRLYLMWTKASERQTHFSLQFFTEDGKKAPQYDRLARQAGISCRRHEHIITARGQVCGPANLLRLRDERQLQRLRYVDRRAN